MKLVSIGKNTFQSILIEWCLKNGYYEPPLAYDNVDWFVNEVVR